VAPQAAQDLRFIERAVSDRRGAPVKAVAYCFCGF
jgi:protease-4